MKLGLKTLDFSRTGKRLLLVTAVLLLVAGCSSFGGPSGRLLPWRGGESSHRAHARQTRKDKGGGWISSLFRTEEPPPPKSVKEWMELEPIRP